MRDERLGDRIEDVEYARDRAAVQLRAQMNDYLAQVTDALTGYRRGNPVDLPAAPTFSTSRS